MQVPILTQQLTAYGKSKGAGLVSFNFDQEVALPGVVNTVRLFWTLSIVDSKPIYGNPIIVNSSPYLLYAIYFSKNVMTGLPAQFANVAGGQLQYQLIKTDGTPISTMTTVDTGGIFDASQPTSSNAGVDADAGLKCLINPANAVGCAPSNISIVSLINQTSSTSAILDYVRMVAPIYKTVTNGDGSISQIAQMSLNVTARNLTANTCHYTYQNQGNYAYDLSTQVDRYYVQPDGNYSRVNQYIGETWSPAVSYDYTAKVLPTQVPSLSSEIIDPTGLTNNLINISDIAILTSLAPIADTGKFNQGLGSWSSQCLIWRAWVSFSAACDASSGDLILTTTMNCNPNTGAPLQISLPNSNVWYPIPMGSVNDDGTHFSGGVPWYAMVDDVGNLWINQNMNIRGSGDTGQNITLNSFRYVFNLGQYTTTTEQTCTGTDDWGNPTSWPCSVTELYQNTFAGINLNNGQIITTTQDLGPYAGGD